jgi:hypothetical protein
MMHSFVDNCIRGELDTEVDASFADGVAVQRAIAAVMDANHSLRWVPLSNPQTE